MESILDGELVWQNVLRTVAGLTGQKTCDRYIRLNPDYKSDPPNMDAKLAWKRLQGVVQETLKKDDIKYSIRSIGRRLIASSFFFHVLRMTPIEESEAVEVHGKVHKERSGNCEYVAKRKIRLYFVPPR